MEAFEYLGQGRMRCISCHRVCGFILPDGKCESPKCRQEDLEIQLDQLALENRDLDIRLKKLERGDEKQ
jgi:hypothetical protein